MKPLDLYLLSYNGKNDNLSKKYWKQFQSDKFIKKNQIYNYIIIKKLKL